MKNLYVTPVCELIAISALDVLASSPIPGDDLWTEDY